MSLHRKILHEPRCDVKNSWVTGSTDLQANNRLFRLLGRLNVIKLGPSATYWALKSNKAIFSDIEVKITSDLQTVFTPASSNTWMTS